MEKLELFSLLHKNHHDLEFTTDSQKLVQNNPKVGCLACLVFLFFSSHSWMSDVAEPVWLLCEIWMDTKYHLEQLPGAAATMSD